MADPVNAPRTAREELLIQQSENTLGASRQVLSWFREAFSARRLNLFELAKFESASMHGFLDSVTVDGQPRTVMGCIQVLRFQPGPASRSGEPQTLRSFTNKSFLRQSGWTHPDGLPGGFGFTPLFCKLRETGSVQRLPESVQDPYPDLELIGNRYEWVLLQVDIRDFVRSAPALRPYVKTLSKVIKESAYIVAHSDFMSAIFPPDTAAKQESGLGYAFVPCTVHPNFFGYGPGRFGTAFKLFHFSLLNTGELQIRMVFISAPRSERVLYFWGADPVYGIVHLANALTLGRLKIRDRAHDKLDKVFLKQHGLVHQDVMLGMRSVWENTRWQA